MDYQAIGDPFCEWGAGNGASKWKECAAFIFLFETQFPLKMGWGNVGLKKKLCSIATTQICKDEKW